MKFLNGAGGARHSVRAVVANPNVSVGRRRLRRSTTPHPRTPLPLDVGRSLLGCWIFLSISNLKFEI